LLNKPLSEDVFVEEGETVIEPRPHQQALRKIMLEYWENSCAVTDIPIEEMLEACHIKPYRDCTPEEKLDPHNGLLLTANLHKLFDSGYISFCPGNGNIIISSELEKLTPTGILFSKEITGLPKEKLTGEHKRYLEWHLQNVFRQKKNA
jgi:predicted restriction endonuclease